MTAEDIVTREVITVRPDTPVETVARLLTNHHIGGMPVVEETGRIYAAAYPPCLLGS